MLNSLIDYAGPFNITLAGIKFLSFMRSRELIETFNL